MSESGMPRWVKVSGLVAVLLLVLLVAALLFGGEHGPGRHFGGLTATPTSVVGG